MAKLIINNDTEQANFLPYSAAKFAIVGAVTGLVFWVLSYFVGYFTDSIIISGNIALILAMIFGVIIMLIAKMTNPLLIAVSVALSLWGMTGWTKGLSTAEMIFWYIALHTISYLLFSWIATIKRQGFAILAAILIIIIIQVIFSLQ